MKWMLLAMMTSATPVKTHLYFDTLAHCLERVGEIENVHEVVSEAYTNLVMKDSEHLDRKATRAVVGERSGDNIRYLCIPHGYGPERFTQSR